MKKIVIITSFFMMFFLFTIKAFSHCEIPCGIYGDEMRFHMLEEHIITMEKSMKMINELTKEKERNYNQIVRWVINKEKHANEMQSILSQYFMTQRVKPVDKNNQRDYKNYISKLTLLHKMIFYSMKAKQNTDTETIILLKDLLNNFKTLYLNVKGKKK